MSKYDTNPGTHSAYKVNVGLDLRALQKIKNIVTEFTPEAPYTANALSRIQIELDIRKQQLNTSQEIESMTINSNRCPHTAKVPLEGKVWCSGCKRFIGYF